MNPGAFDIDEFRELRPRIAASLGFTSHKLDQIYAEAQTGVSKHPPLQSILTLTAASKIPERSIQWVWQGWIPEGKVTVLAGDPGLGKSLITTMIAAKVSNSGSWPVDGGHAPCGDAIILSAEDDASDTIIPRLRIAGADLDRVHILQPTVKTDTPGDKLFSIYDDIPLLEELVKSLDCRIVIIDPASAFTGVIDSHNNAEVRALLFNLKAFAERTGVAVLCVTHFSKGTAGNSPVYRVMGSLAWTAAARSVIGVLKDPDDKRRRLMMPIKSNIADDFGGFAYVIGESEDGIAELQFEPDRVEVAIEDMAVQNTGYGEQIANAEDLLSEMLGKGQKWQRDIELEANRRGISPRTLRRAKKELGVISDKAAGKWIWGLPQKEGGQC